MLGRVTLLVALVLLLINVGVDAKATQHKGKSHQGREKTYEIGLKKVLTITQEQVDEYTKKIKDYRTVKSGTKFYTWTDYGHCIRWHLQGKVHKGEMDYFTHPDRESTLSMAGAGIYLAGSATSSRYFGYCAIEWEVPEDTPYYHDTWANRIFNKGRALSKRQKVDLGTIIPFIHKYGTSDWHVTHHVDVVSNPKVNWELTMQRLHGAVVPQFFEELRNIPSELENNGISGHIVDVWKHTAGYMYSLYTLMYYYDPVSMVRAIHVDPENPWRMFEPENFGSYMEARSSLFRKILVDKDFLGIVKNPGRRYAGSEWSKAAFQSSSSWATKMTEEVLPMIYKTFSGSDIQYRGTGIRAGGDFANKTFGATGQQADVMYNNKWLETHCHKNTDTSNGAAASSPYLCYYHYPDTQHCNPKINTPILPYAIRKFMNSSDSDDSDHEQYTKQMMQALLKDVFVKIRGKQVGATSSYKTDQPTVDIDEDPKPAYFDHHMKQRKTYVNAADLMVQLISIHPCLDFNGRSTRGFVHAAAIEGGLAPPVMSLYDFDLTTEPNTLREFVSKSTQQYEKLQRQMINVMWEKAINGERIHLKNGLGDIENGWINVFKPFEVFGVDVPTEYDNQLDNLIESRDWMNMLNTFGGNGWQKELDSTCNKCQD